MEQGMRSFLAVGLAVAVIVGTSGIADAAGRDRLDGWGPFKFSMTRKQAMAAAGGRAHTGASEQMVYETEIDGETWVAEFRFWGITDPNGSIRSINILPKAGTASAQECTDKFARVVAKLSAKYGAPTAEDNGYTKFVFKNGSRISANTYRASPAADCRPALTYYPPDKTGKSDF